MSWIKSFENTGITFTSSTSMGCWYGVPIGKARKPKTSPSSFASSPRFSCEIFSESSVKLEEGKKLLGRGTFGHVYAAFNNDNGQICAVKEVRVISDDQSSTECLKQLNQEIALISELSHPNIVQYYGSKMEEDKLSVYLEYVSGGSIQKLLNEYGPFSEPVIRSYTKQILCGLAYLHRRNTVHRDIKGANILVDPNGDIKLVDFGMAKHIKSVSSMLSFKGSPYWMAPEVITNTSSCSLAVDIWSLGCTILEMATSKPPWSKYEGVAAIFKIANGVDYPEIPSHLSEDAESFVKLCLQRDPCTRPTTAQLLNHPFIQNQDMREVASVCSVDEACSPCRRHSMAAPCFGSQQLISPMQGRNHRIKHVLEPSRTLKISMG
ncbi:mitogen activated protein kinase kinase kinase 3, mapkkk3, mekk3, putative [Ricinus communis]|uniref:mitogen-activated protein kinase kinase kinase n=1 Tax=Ricinus communis TaxID=3988 RepID=B9S2M7_RICCO|nr:mitogen activated protein kinase kinase kinase 3, mapkkk3, mekk3, putative [Ricinus communis]